MTIPIGRNPKARAPGSLVPAPSLNDSGGGPWGSGGNEDRKGGGLGPRNPWTQPPVGTRGERRLSAIEALLRRGRAQLGGGGGGSPGGDATTLWLWGVLALVTAWLVLTSIHSIGAGERGVVTRLGRFERVIGPGVRVTLPAPFETVATVSTQEAAFDVGSVSAGDQKLVLTRDGGPVSLAYTVRWQVRDPALFLYEVADGEALVRQAAEGALRREFASRSIAEALGAPQAGMAERAAKRAQALLDGDRAGVTVTGVTIRGVAPPAAAAAAFAQVEAARKAAQAEIARAQTEARVLLDDAGREAAAFDRVYAQYELAPEATRRRIYDETMEYVLSGAQKTVIDSPGVNPSLPITGARAPDVKP